MTTVFLSSIAFGREPGGCECGVGWSGEGCSTCAPYPGCANGGCSQPWECTCQVKKKFSVADPHWFQCRSGSSIFCQCGSGSGSRSKVLMTKNWKKFRAEIKFKYFLIKNCNLHIPRPPYNGRPFVQGTGKVFIPHLELQNLNFLHLCGSFWPFWIRPK